MEKIKPEFEIKRWNQIVYKTSLLDRDFIGWKYKFPKEGIVVVVSDFDHAMFWIANWNLCPFKDAEKIPLESFVKNPLIQILTWKELDENDIKFNTGYYALILVFDEQIQFQDMLNCVKFHLVSHKAILNKDTIYNKLKKINKTTLDQSTDSKITADNIYNKLTKVIQQYNKFYEILLGPR